MKKSVVRHSLLSAAACAALSVMAVAPGHLSRRQRSGFLNINYAHRGLYTADQSIPENSLSAFRLAAREGYGIELDVQLSSDGQVVVFHDDTLDRVCGVHARVDALSYEKLSALRLCGTEERIPLFPDVLNTIQGCGALIVELKNGHRNRELCRKTKAYLDTFQGRVCVESFNPLIVAWFRLHAPHYVRGQLTTTIEDYGTEGFGNVGAFVLHHTLLNFLGRPHFIASRIGTRSLSLRLCSRLGAMNFGWTSHDAGIEKDYDAVIFEHYRPEPRFR